jgi:DNA transformation protein and related proteins
MATPAPAFVSHCLELLECLGPMHSKRMFGGWGLYQGDVIVAIIAFERLYLKTSAETRPRFEAEGCAPFVYDARTGAVAMSYWSAPAEALDSPALMQPWARLALQAALAARAAKPAPKPRKKAPAKTPAKASPRG